jgi:hypothetical protein
MLQKNCYRKFDAIPLAIFSYIYAACNRTGLKD